MEMLAAVSLQLSVMVSVDELVLPTLATAQLNHSKPYQRTMETWTQAGFYLHVLWIRGCWRGSAAVS